MQYLTQSGKTTVETADSAISKTHNAEEVRATSALWKSAHISTNDHTRKVTFKLFLFFPVHTMATLPKKTI